MTESLIFSYIYLSSSGSRWRQPRALFGSLLSIAVSLRCVLSGEMLSRVILPFALACLLPKPSAFLVLGRTGDKQEENKRNLDIVSFDGSTFLWLEQIELTFFVCAFWLISDSRPS